MNNPLTQSNNSWLHFVGVGGSGMSGLAQYHALAGGRATGSDRAFDSGERERTRQWLTAAGVGLFPQDGSGLVDANGRTCDTVIVSTAVEDSISDFAMAKNLDVPILHRSELLAHYVAEKKTIAITGTSGKSSVTAMVFEILRDTGKEPSLLTGGNLISLQEEGFLGNAWAGTSDLLVIEADESDGSLVRYEPWLGVVLNLRLDHKPLTELATMFATFHDHTRGPFLVGVDPNLQEIAQGATVFGFESDSDIRAQDVRTTQSGSSFTVGDIQFRLTIPGVFNVTNALAAIAACQQLDVPFVDMVEPMANFRGVARRFQSVGVVKGVEIIDDFAHNPDKIGAALTSAQARTSHDLHNDHSPERSAIGRILAVFQPHGFGPTRFLKNALIEAFVTHLRPDDKLWMPEIYYAGGTVTRDISSYEIVTAITERGLRAEFIAQRSEIVGCIAAEARPGDIVLVMGARDPSLTDFCYSIKTALE